MIKINVEKLREKCIENLSLKRKSIIDAGVTVDDICLKSTDKAHGNMAGYITESVIDGLVDVLWKCSDGSRRLYTVQELKPVFKQITYFRKECFVVEDTLLTQIESANDPASIDIEAGWPTNILATV